MARRKPDYPPAMSETELQTLVIETARLLGWRHYHTHDSRRSVPGYPDLTLVRARLGEPPRVIWVELKQDDEKPTADQQEWLNDLLALATYVAAGMDEWVIRVHVWRTADWLSGAIERVLRG